MYPSTICPEWEKPDHGDWCGNHSTLSIRKGPAQIGNFYTFMKYWHKTFSPHSLNLSVVWCSKNPFGIERGNAETITLPRCHKWDMYHNRVFLPMTQDLRHVEVRWTCFWSISKQFRVMWTTCFKLWLQFWRDPGRASTRASLSEPFLPYNTQCSAKLGPWPVCLALKQNFIQFWNNKTCHLQNASRSFLLFISLLKAW